MADISPPRYTSPVAPQGRYADASTRSRERSRQRPVSGQEVFKGEASLSELPRDLRTRSQDNHPTT